MKLNIISATILGLSICANVCAEEIEPVFSGEWYTETSWSVFDNCKSKKWSYKHKNESQSQLFSIIYPDFPKYNNCEWGKTYYVGDDKNMPPDYPLSNWYQTSHNIKSQYWRVDCKHKNGTILYSLAAILYPRYICPDGTKVSFDGQNCEKRDDSCVSDVAGRDLGLPGVSYVGHVGMMSQKDGVNGGGKYVMEVTMGNSPVINIHTLDSFINAVPGKYWGEVYGLSGVDIDYNMSLNILNYGWAQRAFNPEYVPFSIYQEGKYIDGYIYESNKNKMLIERPFKQALFRCDTFVYYSYLKAGVKIKLDKMLPKNLYDAFMNKRKYSSLNNISNKNEFNIENIDTIMDFLKNKNYSRQEKINTIYSQLKNAKTDILYNYILDALSFIRPFELIPSFVSDYAKENDVNKKVKLIKAITMSSQSITIKTNVNYDENDVDNIYKINAAKTIDLDKIKFAQDFIINILKLETNHKILNESILSLFGILPINRENYFIVVNSMDKMGSSLDLELKNKYLIIMSLNNKEMQKWLLPQLLSKDISEKEKQSFTNELYFFIKQLKPNDIDDEVKPELIKYINSLNYSFDKIYSLSTLTSKTSDERDSKLLTYICSLDDYKMQAEIISNIDNKVLSKLTKQNKENLLIKFRGLINNNDGMTYAIAYSKISGL